MQKRMYLDTSAEWTAAELNIKSFTHIVLLSAHIAVDFRIQGRNSRLRAGFKSEIAAPGFICTFPREKWEQVAKIKELYPHIKLIISVGGRASEGFSDMAQSRATRKIFADSVALYLKNHNLDGIDIDWEYPTIQGRGYIKSRPSDKLNFLYLLEELRAAIGADKEITYSASAGDWYIDSIDLIESTRYINGVHLQTFGFANETSLETRHHTNLFVNDTDPNPRAESVDKAVLMYIHSGLPAEMLYIGCAAYGIEFRNLTVFDRERLPGLFFKFTNKDPYIWQNGVIPYNVLHEYYINKNGYTRFEDESAAADYLYSSDEKAFITYDSPSSIKSKIEYAEQNKLGGIFAYEYTQGAKARLWDAFDSTPKAMDGDNGR